MRKSVKAVLVALLALTLITSVVGCGSNSDKSSSEKKSGPTIVVGSKTFTEALLLGSLTYQYLQHLGYPVKDKTGLGELAVIRPALLSGQVSCYWEYNNTVAIEVMKQAPSTDSEKSYQAVKAYDAKKGIDWLEYAPLNDTYGFMVRPDIAQKYNLKTMSDLFKAVQGGAKITFVSTQEYDNRADGFPEVVKKYGEYPKSLIKDAALNVTYEALKNKSADAGLAFTTDARIKAYNLVVLEDDQKVFPVYNPSPLFTQKTIDAYPQLPEQMKKLSSLLDTETITDLNKQVDVDKKSVNQVAKEFLTAKGLI
jgi:osmoprotectant transport system substrate-binding protein